MAPRKTARRDAEESAPPRANIVDILKRRGWWGLAAFLLVFPPLVSLVRFLPDVYLSTATILIERQQIPDDLVRSTVTSALEVRLQTITQEILSRSRIQEIIDQFGLYPDLKEKAPVEQLVGQMRDDVKLDFKGGDRRGATIAFSVSYRGRDPQQVAQVTNALARLYIEENLKIRERQAAGTAGFLRQQLDDLALKLKEQEKKVSEFKARHLGELPEQLDANLQTLEQLTTQLRLNGENLARAGERRGNIERELSAALGTSTPTGPDVSALRLAQLKGALASLQTRLSDKHPDVQRLKNEIANLETALAARGTDGAGALASSTPLLPQVQQLKSTLLELESQIRGLEAESITLKRQINSYQARVEQVPRVQQEYQIMAREYETTQEMYRSLTVRQRESALSESMEQRQKGEQFRVIEPALPAETPAAPRRPRLFALALMAALAAAVAAIFGPEALDSSVHTVEQLQARCDLPVLVSIPQIVGPDDLSRQRRQVALAVTGLTVAVMVLVTGGYFLAKENAALSALLIR